MPNTPRFPRGGGRLGEGKGGDLPSCCIPGRAPCRRRAASPRWRLSPPSWGRRACGRAGTAATAPAGRAANTPRRTCRGGGGAVSAGGGRGGPKGVGEGRCSRVSAARDADGAVIDLQADGAAELRLQRVGGAGWRIAGARPRPRARPRAARHQQAPQHGGGHGTRRGVRHYNATRRVGGCHQNATLHTISLWISLSRPPPTSSSSAPRGLGASCERAGSAWAEPRGSWGGMCQAGEDYGGCRAPPGRPHVRWAGIKGWGTPPLGPLG